MSPSPALHVPLYFQAARRSRVGGGTGGGGFWGNCFFACVVCGFPNRNCVIDNAQPPLPCLRVSVVCFCDYREQWMRMHAESARLRASTPSRASLAVASTHIPALQLAPDTTRLTAPGLVSSSPAAPCRLTGAI